MQSHTGTEREKIYNLNRTWRKRHNTQREKKNRQHTHDNTNSDTLAYKQSEIQIWRERQKTHSGKKLIHTDKHCQKKSDTQAYIKLD